MVPQLFGEDTLIVIIALGTFITGLGASVFFKPKSWYIALGVGTIVASTSLYTVFKPAWGGAVFMTLAIALVASCAVTGISLGHIRIKKKEVKQQNEDEFQEKSQTDSVVDNIIANCDS